MNSDRSAGDFEVHLMLDVFPQVPRLDVGQLKASPRAHGIDREVALPGTFFSRVEDGGRAEKAVVSSSLHERI